MREDLKAAKFLFDKIKRIYPMFDYPDDLDVEIWTEVLEGFSQVDILDALKTYRKTVEYNRPPTPAEFKKYLKKPEEVTVSLSDNQPEFKAIAPAENLMEQDIKLKRCRHNLYAYQAAVRYILEDLLLQEIPINVWKKLKFSDRYEMAQNKGLFDNFDEILIGVCRRDKGKDYEFDSETMIENLKQNRAFNVNKAAQNLGDKWHNAWWHN